MQTSTITTAKKTRIRAAGKTKASQTVYLVRDKAGAIKYLGKSESEAKEASAKHCHGIAPESFGSRASLAEQVPSVVLDKWLECQSLAKLHLSLGGSFGPQSQNAENAKRVATILARAFANCDIPLPAEFPDGEWTVVSTGGTSKGPSADEQKRIEALKAKYAAMAQK